MKSSFLLLTLLASSGSACPSNVTLKSRSISLTVSWVPKGLVWVSELKFLNVFGIEDTTNLLSTPAPGQTIRAYSLSSPGIQLQGPDTRTLHSYIPDNCPDLSFAANSTGGSLSIATTLGYFGKPFARETWTISLNDGVFEWGISRHWERQATIISNRLAALSFGTWIDMPAHPVNDTAAYILREQVLSFTDLNMRIIADPLTNPQGGGTLLGDRYENQYQFDTPSATQVLKFSPTGVVAHASLYPHRFFYSKKECDGTCRSYIVGVAGSPTGLPTTIRMGASEVGTLRLDFAFPSKLFEPVCMVSQLALSLPDTGLEALARSFVDVHNQQLGYIIGNNPASSPCIHEAAYFSWGQSVLYPTSTAAPSCPLPQPATVHSSIVPSTSVAAHTAHSAMQTHADDASAASTPDPRPALPSDSPAGRPSRRSMGAAANIPSTAAYRSYLQVIFERAVNHDTGYVLPRWKSDGFYNVYWGPLHDQLPHLILALEVFVIQTNDTALLQHVWPQVESIISYMNNAGLGLRPHPQAAEYARRATRTNHTTVRPVRAARGRNAAAATSGDGSRASGGRDGIRTASEAYVRRAAEHEGGVGRPRRSKYAQERIRGGAHVDASSGIHAAHTGGGAKPVLEEWWSGVMVIPGQIGEQSTGLPDGGRHGTNWYDVINFGRLDAIVNVFAVDALRATRDLAQHIGKRADAMQYASMYANAVTAFNNVFFDEEVGFYTDWIDSTEHRHNYLYADSNLYAIAAGIADKDKAAKVLAAIDASYQRIAKAAGVATDDIYSTPCNFFSLPSSSYYTVPEEDPPPFPGFENGVSFFHTLGIEILARARAGQPDAAYALFDRVMNKGYAVHRFSAQHLNWLNEGATGQDYLNNALTILYGFLQGTFGVKLGVGGVQLGAAATAVEGARWRFIYMGGEICVTVVRGRAVYCSSDAV